MAKKLTEVPDEIWENEINEFNRMVTEEFLEQEHLSPQTLNQYRSALKQFFYWVYQKSMNKQVTDLKPRDALRYQNYLGSLELSSSSIKFKRSAVSSLCGYIEIYYSDEFPTFRNIYTKSIPSPPKSTVHEKQPLSDKEMKKLIKALAKREKWQQLAYVLFTYSTGCRREESRQLLKEVANYKTVEGKKYYVTHKIRAKGRGKNGKVRRFNFDEETMIALKKWLQERGKDDCEYMFVSKNNDGEARQIAPSTFNYWCKTLFSEIVGRRVHPHLFRSSRATNLDKQGKNISAIQKILGHQSSETTQIYIVNDDEDEIDEIFE